MSLLHTTELEGAALAVIWRHQPCTPYAVMQEFRASATPEWSASTGAIYPLIRRLEARGLVGSSTEQWGRKGKKALRLTAAGEEAFRGWVGELAPRAGQLALDTARTRAYFLDALAGADRLAVIGEAEREATTLLARLEANLATADDPDSVGALAAEGGLYAVRARLEWLRAVRKRIPRD